MLVYGRETAKQRGGPAVVRADQPATPLHPVAGLTPVTFLVTFGAGLLTSLSPCTLSVLPLTIGYIGGYSGSDAGTDKPSVVPRCGSALADVCPAVPQTQRSCTLAIHGCWMASRIVISFLMQYPAGPQPLPWD